jgi:hypothetical protein
MADVSPDLFIDAVLAFQQTAAIKAAVELDLFSKVARGTNTAEALAKQTGAAVRGIRILCDYLTVRGHLEKHGQEYRLTSSEGDVLAHSAGLDVAFMALLRCSEPYAAVAEVCSLESWVGSIPGPALRYPAEDPLDTPRCPRCSWGLTREPARRATENKRSVNQGLYAGCAPYLLRSCVASASRRGSSLAFGSRHQGKTPIVAACLARY